MHIIKTTVDISIFDQNSRHTGSQSGSCCIGIHKLLIISISSSPGGPTKFPKTLVFFTGVFC